MDIKKLIIEDNCTILDVRTSEEYNYGNVPGSVNIPLDQIVSRIEEVKALKKPLILCCASGARSGSVKEYLGQNDIECVNGGSWMDLNFKQLKSA